MTSNVLLLALLTACAYDARYEDCAIHCSVDSGCPDDFVCGAERLCRTPGTTDTCAMVLSTFPSCSQLAMRCGADGTDDCCSTAEPIPGGSYYRSYDIAADGSYPSMSYPATVSPFILDKYEVTVGRFRKFVEAGMGTRANPPAAGTGARFLNGAPAQGGWDANWNTSLPVDSAALVAAVKCDASFQSWTDVPTETEQLPINCVTWYEAFAFCAWDGGFLPTEAQWNFAAAGGAEQRAYPWSMPAGSTAIDCSYANYYIDVPPGAHCVGESTGFLNSVGAESPKGDGRWKQTDLAGNVWEWTLDMYVTPYSSSSCNDCAKLDSSSDRTFRGGGFLFNGASDLRTGSRFGGSPNSRAVDVGFRCSRPFL